MTQGLLKSIFGLALLAILIVVTVLNIWQTDRTEKKQIELIDRVGQIEKTLEKGLPAAGSAAAASPSGGIFGVAEPSYITEAFRDPNNVLVRDAAWLPPVAEGGGTLNLKFGSDPKGFNFVAENGADVSEIQKYVSMFLIKYHRTDPAKKAADLAYSLVISEDKKTFTFKLREDVYWHEPAVDFGTGDYDWLKGDQKVTANDMVFMLDMLMNPQVAGAAPIRSYFESLESYKAIDDYTLEIKWSEAKYTHLMIMHSIYPVPEFIYAFDEQGNRYDESVLGQRFQDHWYNPRAIGCGPYRFVTFEPGVKIELERDPRFPLGGNAHDTIMIRILKDQNAWARLLRTGELHLSQLQPGQYRSEVLEGAPESPFKDGTLQGGEFWTHSYFYIGWNSDKPWFGDKQVRWAMSHAFNAELLLEDVFMGLGERVTGPMPTINAPYYDDSLPAIPFDLDKAAQLLEGSGWVDSNENGIRDKTVDGQLVEFEFDLTVYGSSDEYKTLGNIYKEDLAKVGVKMNVRPMEWSNLLKRVDDREFDAVTLAWVSSPDVDFYQIWHSTQADIPKGSNRVGFRNPKADEIIEALQREFDYDERVRLANSFHRLVYEEQPYTFFYTRKRKVYWQRQLESVTFGKVRPYMNPRPWFLASAGQ
ncbi:MAG: hypothetical protein KDA24_10415 [Deltaproteobacteria bacterium]|nr:hypothetical protein [Deltaproteobacteria bacterium]